MEKFSIQTVIVSIIITALAYMAFPLIKMLFSNGTFERKRANRIALWNSIVVGIIFFVLTTFSDIGRAWNVGPAVLYFFINRYILTDKTNGTPAFGEKTEPKRNYKCGRCGKIGPYDGNCPDCGSSLRLYFDVDSTQEGK